MKRVIDGQAFDVDVSFVPGGDLGGRVRAIMFRDGERVSSLTAPPDSKFEKADSRLHLAPLVDDVERRMRDGWDDLGGAFARYCPDPIDVTSPTGEVLTGECGAILYVTSEQVAKLEMGKCPNGHTIIFPGRTTGIRVDRISEKAWVGALEFDVVPDGTKPAYAGYSLSFGGVPIGTFSGARGDYMPGTDHITEAEFHEVVRLWDQALVEAGFVTHR